MAIEQKILKLTTEERLALLLSILGPDAAKAALKSINPTRAKFVSKLLEDFKLDPPSSEEIEYIVNDFNKYFSFAVSTLGPQIEQATKSAIKKDKKNAKTDEPSEEDLEHGPKITLYDPIEETGDIAHDLNQLNAFQIATALKQDHPKTIALVLRNLTTSLSAKVIQGLPEESRNAVVIVLSQPSTVPQLICDKVLKTTFAKANTVRSKREETDEAEALAQLMRSLPKEIRNELIEKLTEENSELVQEIRSKLYVFDDLSRLDDRDIQKVLGETETDILIVALQQADPKLTASLLGNLSKRARQTIEEEMQYKTGVSEAEIQESRGKLVEVVGRLDEAGEITLS